MSALAAAVVIALLSAPAPVPAQQWSAEQQEVVTHLKECWDIWDNALRSGEGPDAWLDQCSAPGYSYWWIYGTPMGEEELRREWEIIRETEAGWISLRPVNVFIRGDIAIMQFFGYWRQQDSPDHVGGHRTEVFERIDGRWKLLVGHASPEER